MAADPFNSLGGFTVGIPAIEVIDANGNIVSNFLNLSGNVSANKVYANYYYFANGQPFTSPAGGSNTQLQFNNNGVFGGIPNVTYNGNILNLGNVSTLSISGGDNGYFLQTDGLGNLSWAAAGGGSNGNPGGTNTQVQFNDNGLFGGDVGFTYNKNTNLLNVDNISIGNLSVTSDSSIVGNTSITGNLSVTQTFQATGNITGGNLITTGRVSATGNISGNYFIGNGSLLTGIITDIANYVAQPNQSNITSVGNLTFLNVDGEIASTGNITSTGNIIAFNLNTSNNIGAATATITNRLTVGSNLTLNTGSVLRALGNVNFNSSPNVTLGPVSNVRITGGTNGDILATDGTGNLAWVSVGGGGNGNPGGTNTQVQYNKLGLFGGSPFFTFNEVTKVVNIAGDLIANTVQIGAGAFTWSTNEVYFATTTSSTPNQVIYSIPVSEISGVEFQIMATDPTGPSRQFCKISSVYYNGYVEYNEYASLFVNGGVGNFSVDYFAGNILVPPSLELKVTPSSANTTTYKMLITVFAP